LRITIYSNIFIFITVTHNIYQKHGPWGQKIMRSANNVGNAGPHVRQAFLNDVFTFLTEVGNTGRAVNTGTSSVNSDRNGFGEGNDTNEGRRVFLFY
jgi:hypothetical protein